MYTDVQKSYSKYNRIRSKLLIFIDNEIQSKIKQNKQNLKFSCNDDIRISFEETFIQNQTNKYDFPSSNILKPKKNDNFDKSLSTHDISLNKITKKSCHKKRDYTHSKILGYYSSKLINNIISFKKKFYSIKNLSKQSSTFLILPKQKNAAKYLKTLCNKLKKHKIDKKPAKHIRLISISSKLFDFNKDKKVKKKPNIPKKYKSKKDLGNFSFCRKSLKGSLLINSKLRIYGKSNNSILMTLKQKK